MIKKQYKPYVKVIIQIFLIISMSWAFSYIVHQTDNLVSAQESTVVNTCLRTKDEYGGKICQEYLAQECNDKCETLCIEATVDHVAGCKKGICYDEEEGICTKNSPREECEYKEGDWYEMSPPECELGCCKFGDDTGFITERQCGKIGEEISSEFIPGIDELICALIPNLLIEGACIIYSGEEKRCEFRTGESCLALRSQGMDIDFHENSLCSHLDLDMGYEKQYSTKCIEGKQEVYWVDDQGNRENIYEGDNSLQKESSWNNGMVKIKSDSCTLTSLNIGTCGNCDEFSSFFPTSCDDSGEKAICEDLSCKEGPGVEDFNIINERYPNHGESWCYYQGSVLPKEGSRELNRSTATPGSRQFKLYCYKGEVSYEGCEDRRAGICQQEIITRDDGSSFSMASCRTNLASQCVIYNTWDNKTKAMDICEKNPDCFIKEIRVPHSPFNFDACVSKYPMGFDNSNQGIGRDICGLASLKCETARIKQADGTIKEINRGCKRDAFTEQMNDFCMSFGDCGASANYIGEYGDGGYSISRSTIKLKENYIDSLKDYANKIIGDYIKTAEIESIYESLVPEGGILGEGTGKTNFPDASKEGWKGVSGIGTGGLTLLTLGSQLSLFTPVTQVVYAAGLKGAAQQAVVKLGLMKAPTTTYTSWYTTFAGAVVGAALGAALAGWWIKVAGIGAGLSGSQYYGLVAVAAVGGAITGAALVSSAGFTAASGPYGLIIVAIVLLTIAIMKWAGVGKVKTNTISFECMPWQPPAGKDNCGKCYDDGFGCSNYSCENLGLACEFFNEGTSFEICEWAEKDLSPPTIKPLEGVLPSGFAYEEIGENGFKVISTNTEDGCIPAFTPVMMGIELNKRGRCTFSIGKDIFTEDEIMDWLNDSAGEFTPENFGLKSNYFLGEVKGEDSLQNYSSAAWEEEEEMVEFYFGGNNLFLHNHTHPLYYPSLGSLGIGGFGPDRRVDFDMKVRCEDRNGNFYPKDYIIRTCLGPQKDIFPATIIDQDPINELVKNDTINVNFSVYANEPVECRWSLEDNKEYELMSENFNCETDPNKPSLRQGGSFKCSSSSPITSDDLTLFVRCQDQPWLSGTENESERNIMDESYVMNLIKTSSLNINSIILNEGRDLEFGTIPAEVGVKVTTSGGAYNGYAECGYLFQGAGFIPFSVTFGTTHRQLFDQFDGGEKRMSIMCEDSIGNVVYGNSSFVVIIDNDPPLITRAFKDGGKLKIYTDEEAICYYDYDDDRCNFNINEADSMSVRRTTTHTANWNPGSTYYIKCKDKWDRFGPGCSIIIKAEEI